MAYKDAVERSNTTFDDEGRPLKIEAHLKPRAQGRNLSQYAAMAFRWSVLQGADFSPWSIDAVVGAQDIEVSRNLEPMSKAEYESKIQPTLKNELVKLQKAIMEKVCTFHYVYTIVTQIEQSDDHVKKILKNRVGAQLAPIQRELQDQFKGVGKSIVANSAQIDSLWEDLHKIGQVVDRLKADEVDTLGAEELEAVPEEALGDILNSLGETLEHINLTFGSARGRDVLEVEEQTEEELRNLEKRFNTIITNLTHTINGKINTLEGKIHGGSTPDNHTIQDLYDHLGALRKYKGDHDLEFQKIRNAIDTLDKRMNLVEVISVDEAESAGGDILLSDKPPVARSTLAAVEEIAERKDPKFLTNRERIDALEKLVDRINRMYGMRVKDLEGRVDIMAKSYSHMTHMRDSMHPLKIKVMELGKRMDACQEGYNQVANLKNSVNPLKVEVGELTKRLNDWIEARNVDIQVLYKLKAETRSMRTWLTEGGFIKHARQPFTSGSIEKELNTQNISDSLPSQNLNLAALNLHVCRLDEEISSIQNMLDTAGYITEEKFNTLKTNHAHLFGRFETLLKRVDLLHGKLDELPTGDSIKEQLSQLERVDTNIRSRVYSLEGVVETQKGLLVEHGHHNLSSRIEELEASAGSVSDQLTQMCGTDSDLAKCVNDLRNLVNANDVEVTSFFERGAEITDALETQVSNLDEQVKDHETRLDTQRLEAMAPIEVLQAEVKQLESADNSTQEYVNSLEKHIDRLAEQIRQGIPEMKDIRSGLFERIERLEQRANDADTGRTHLSKRTDSLESDLREDERMLKTFGKRTLAAFARIAQLCKILKIDPERLRKR